MKFRESMSGKKKLLDPVEEVKNNPSASSDNLSQGGESSQQEKKKKKNPQQQKTQGWKKRDLKFDHNADELLETIADMTKDPNSTEKIANVKLRITTIKQLKWYLA